jgi:hypothetical protein
LSLEWDAVDGDVTYYVYLGQTSALDDDDLVRQSNRPDWRLPVLEPGTTYYWRVDTGNSCATTTGEVWSFSTSEQTWQLIVNTVPSSGRAAVRTHADGESVSIDVPAAPEEDMVFAGWSGDVPASERFDDPLVLLMDSDKTVFATFERVDAPASSPRRSLCGALGLIPLSFGCIAAWVGLRSRIGRPISNHASKGAKR